MRVLVAEDNDALRQRLTDLVREIPGVTEVSEAGDGASALAQLAGDPPDLLTLDLHMPGVNGFRVMQELAGAERAPLLMVVSNLSEYRDYCLGRGAAFFFDKTTQLDDLISTIGALARSSPPVFGASHAALSTAIVQTLVMPIAVLDSAGNVEAGNEAFLQAFPLPATDAGKRPLSGLGTGQWNREDVRTACEDILAGRAPEATVEVTYQHPLDGERVTRLHLALLATAGVVSEPRVLLQFDDVTERRQLALQRAQERRELARSNAALMEFAHAASHDLQEPLRKVVAFTDRVRDRYGALLPEEGRDYLARVSAATLRMRTLIDGMLECARASAEPPHFTAVDLHRVALEVLDDLDGRIEACGARITVDRLPSIDADEFQMRQLMQNLLSNALKFQRPSGPVEIAVRGERRDSMLELCVQDNGIGFEDKYRERIFGMFKRLHTREEYHGSGIGLALCRTIVERHGGTIVAIGSPGAGSTFTITLPLTHRPAAALGAAIKDMA